jgi:hypothetical protein
MKYIKWFLSIMCFVNSINLFTHSRAALAFLSFLYGIYFNPKFKYSISDLFKKDASNAYKVSINILIALFYFIIILPSTWDATDEIEKEIVDLHNENATKIIDKTQVLFNSGKADSAWKIIVSAANDDKTKKSDLVRKKVNVIDNFLVEKFSSVLQNINLDSSKYYLDLYYDNQPNYYRLSDTRSLNDDKWIEGKNRYEKLKLDKINYDSNEFLFTTFKEMNIETYKKLKIDKLDSTFLVTDYYNERFITKMINNIDKGKKIIDSLRIKNILGYYRSKSLLSQGSDKVTSSLRINRDGTFKMNFYLFNNSWSKGKWILLDEDKIKLNFTSNSMGTKIDSRECSFEIKKWGTELYDGDDDYTMYR